MRMIFLLATLLPSIACAADWVELGKTPEARIMLDKASIETFEGGAKAWLKLLYHHKQPGQTITNGKPFDSSANQYYLVCSTQQYQVLELVMFYKNETVGTFHGHFDANNLDQAKLGTGVLLLLNKLCPGTQSAATAQKN